MRFLKQYGRRLLARQYPIVPIKTGYKYPKGLDEWERTQADERQLSQWLANGFANGGVGILTKHYPAVDLDVLDVEIAEKLEAWCQENIGNTLSRTGQAPKTLLVYRTDQPFSKYTSTHYEDYLGDRHRIEVLGEGQQFVAYATHPGTGEAYTWQDGKGLADVDPNSLPVITPDQITALFAYFDELAEASDWEVVKRSRDGADRKTYANDAEAVLAHTKPPLDISKEKIKKTLAALSSDDYNDWITVGMGLYHQFDGSDEGLMLWDAWSAGSDKYAAGVCEAKWPSFDVVLKHHEPTTFASALALANEHIKGSADGDDSDGVDFQDPLNRFVDRYVYIEKGNSVADLEKPPHECITKLEEFRNRTANIRHEIDVPAPTEKDPGRTKTKTQAVHLSWLVHPDRQSAEGARYVPDGERVVTDEYGMQWINKFYLPPHKEGVVDESRLKILFDHMAYLFPVENEREWFYDWMAFGLQRPEERCKVVPLHVSTGHGTGRGFLVELIRALVGWWNVSTTKLSHLAGEGSAGQYNEYLSEKLFCVIEEAKEEIGSGKFKRYAVSDKIRDILSDNYLNINTKYGGKGTERVYPNFLWMSNHTDAIVLDPNDRRINVFFCLAENKPNEYYARLYQWLKSPGNVDHLFRWLMARNLKDFNWQRSMHNEARQFMIESNQSETEQLYRELLANPPARAMTYQQIIDHLYRLSEKDAFELNLNESQVTALLRQTARHSIKQIKVEGNPVRPWILTRDEMDNKTIRAEIEKAGGLQK